MTPDNPLLRAALAAHEAGISVAIVKEDGSKSPDGQWKKYQQERASRDQVVAWYGNGRKAFGYYPGAVSGNLEMIEVEGRAIREGLWIGVAERAQQTGLGELFMRVVSGTVVDATPGRGLHLHIRCSEGIEGNLKLARRPATPEELAENPKDAVKVLFETRGEGGFVVGAPSHGTTHPTGKPYVRLYGTFSSIPVVTAKEREALLGLFRSFDRMPKKAVDDFLFSAEGNSGGWEVRPGVDYAAKTSWPEILEPRGWRSGATRADGNQHWLRPGKQLAPGKTFATSATISENGTGLLYIWSSSTEFEDEKAYGKFSAYSILNHGGDYKAAAKALFDKGYGKKREQQGQTTYSASTMAAPEPFFGDSGFIPARLGAYLTSEHGIALGVDGSLYRHMDGYYRPDGEGWVKQRTRELLGERCRQRHVTETLYWLRCDLPSISANPSTRLLNLSNGLLDWKTGKLLPHSADDHSTIRIPTAWRPGAKCPAIDQFLMDVLPPDCIDLVLELFGYALYPANPFQKAVLLLGPAGNGKGTLLNLLTALCGVDNVSSRTLHDLADDRFAKADLYGRLANICGDLDARNVERSDTFKMLTGGDAVTGENKYARAFKFVNFALLAFSANQVPPSSDQTQAYFDRWLVVPMMRRIRGTSMEVPDLIARLTTPAELEGLLQLAIAALRRLMERGRFEVPASVRAAGEEMRAELDSVLAFMDERIERDTTWWTPRPEVYAAYAEWCAANGRRALKSRDVYAKLLEHLPEIQVTTRLGVRGLEGIRLR